MKEIIYKEILNLFWPIFMTLFLTSFLKFIDQAMISYYDINAVSSINIATQLQGIFGPMYFAILSGVNIFSVQYYSQDKIKEVKYLFYFAIKLMVPVALVYFIISFFFTDQFINLFVSTSTEVGEMASQYLKIMSFNAIIMPLSMIFTYQYRAIRKPKIPLYTGIAQALLNIILNYILIFGHLGFAPMGIEGAAYATLISTICFIIVNIYIANKLKAPFLSSIKNVFIFDFEIDKLVIKKILPLILVEFSFGFSRVIYTKIYTLVPLMQFAAYQISRTLALVANGLVIATANVCGIMTGKALAREEDMDDVLKKLYKFMGLCAILVTLIVAFILPIFIPVFNIDKQYYIVARHLLWIEAIFMGFRVFNSSNLAIMKSGGATTISLLADAGITYIVGIPITIILLTTVAPNIVVLRLALIFEAVVRFIVTMFIVKSSIWRIKL